MNWTLSSCLIAFLAHSLIRTAEAAQNLDVDAPCGKMKGFVTKAPSGESYVAFQSIPYAEPPVGDLRFEKPRKYPAFGSVFDASKHITVCPPPDLMRFLEEGESLQEDCLHLNVYAKEILPVTRKKVIVWIHGGGFVAGGAYFYHVGSFVTSQDVIVVTINYRLGVLGFLSTEDEVIPGNNGLWDMRMALKWVKDNIEAFGGDSSDITIAGESSGAAAVGAFCLSPETKGLFSKAFLMSATMTTIVSLSSGAKEHALVVASDAQCYDGKPEKKISVEESVKILKCLRERPLGDFTKFSGFALHKTPFVPHVDGVFIPKHPQALLSDEKYLESIGFYDRTYLFGIDNSEFSTVHNYMAMTEAATNGLENKTDEEKTKMIESGRNMSLNFYIKSRLRLPGPAPEELLTKIKDWYERRKAELSLVELVTDLSFLIPAYDYLDAIARKRSTDAYFFYFDHYPAFVKGRYRGTIHGAELLYWFDFDMESHERFFQGGIHGEMDEEDLMLKKEFSNLIGQFVKTGNPGNGLKDKLPGGWPTYDTQGSHYMDFSPQPSIKTHLFKEKYDLWKTIIPKWVSESEKHRHTEL